MHLCFEPHPCLAHITINAYRVNRAHHFHAPWSAAMSTMTGMITECPDRTGDWYAGWAAFTSHMERCLRIEKLLLNCDYITIVVHINESDGKTKLVMEGIQTPDFSPRMIENHPVNVNIVREDLAETRGDLCKEGLGHGLRCRFVAHGCDAHVIEDVGMEF